MASANTHTANDTTFDAEVLQSPVPVLVDFWAEWCGPCRMIGPMLDQIADETTGQAKVVKVNVDECRDLALRYQVRSIPMLLFFKGGQVADTVVGAGTAKDTLKAKLLALA
jgi:thioredoxin 1